MKKVLLTVLLLSFVSCIPSFGMRIIINDDSNRVVPDRSTSFTEVSDTLSSYYNDEIYSLQSKKYGYIKDISNQQFENIHLPLLVRDIRSDFILLAAANSSQNENLSKTEVASTSIIDQTRTRSNLFSQYGTRFGENEAADYYIKDTLR